MTLGEHNLGRLAEESFERHGDREAVFFEGTWYRSGELHERSMRLASGFAELGIEPGDRVAVMMASTPEVGIAYTALWRAGAAITPAIFLLSTEELHYILEHSEAKAIITTPEFLPNVKTAAEGVETLKFVVSAGPEEDGVIALSSLEQAEPSDIVPRSNDDLAALMYTGGTTGRAKGVALSHTALWYAGKCGEEASHRPGINRSLIPLPLSHSYGLLVTVVGMHSREPGRAVLMRWFDPQGWLQLAQDHKVQLAAVVPSMLQMLLGMPLEDYDLSSLEYIVSGASPLAAEVVHEFERRVPSVEIREGYGLTETAALISTNPPGERRLGSVGKPVPGTEIRIVDEGGADLPRGDVGEILARSPNLMQGYWKAPETTEEALREGWLYTGDMGYLDEEGYLFIVDRKKDLILRGGFNVFPRDVEDALLEHPGVEVVGVVGRPDRVLGEEVVAFVSLRSGQELTSDELIDFAKQRLGKYKYPREVNIMPSVPLTPVGKVDRKALRALL
ncbi:MAG: class I adenylate-forming enzyme family protein [Actinomycetota bacterium]